MIRTCTLCTKEFEDGADQQEDKYWKELESASMVVHLCPRCEDEPHLEEKIDRFLKLRNHRN